MNVAEDTAPTFLKLRAVGLYSGRRRNQDMLHFSKGMGLSDFENTRLYGISDRCQGDKNCHTIPVANSTSFRSISGD